MSLDTATRQPFSELGDNMIDGPNLAQPADTAKRPAVVTLPPKRRSKLAFDRRPQESLPVPIVPIFSRGPRMKRSGSMEMHWRNGATEEHP
ncbi:MAG TPA: hypothetical protein VKS98_11610, partial [Chthoniobacterales bacterium]|nr:hypothetical protein [Chthoniobacterales bacterium]